VALGDRVYKRSGHLRHQSTLTDDQGRAIGEIEWWLREPQVTVGTSVVPRRLDVMMQGDGYQPALTMRIEVLSGVPQCRALSIEAVEGGREITTNDLRSVRLADWIEGILASVALDLVEDRDDGTRVSAYGSTTTRSATKAVRRARQPRKITPEVLGRVAEIYRANVDGKPTLAVKRSFGVGERAAAGYVQRARAAGLLPQTTPGKKRA
jgi:hypothetical protein